MSALRCYNNIRQIINLKRGKVDFGLEFGGITQWSGDPWPLGLWEAILNGGSGDWGSDHMVKPGKKGRGGRSP